MKIAFFLISFVLCFTQVYSQTTPPATTPRGSSYQDSIRSQQNIKNEKKVVDGITMNSVMDIVENLTQSKTHTLFLASLRSASLVGTFKSRGPLTVFVPNDSAFLKRFSQSQIDSLLKPDHKYELSNIVTYHVVAGRFNTKDIVKLIKAGNGETTFLTLSGSKLIARIDTNRNIVLLDETGGQSVVSQFDILQSNGILHTVNTVLIPKDKAL